MRHNLFNILYSTFIFLLTVYFLLDVFVIPKKYSKAEDTKEESEPNTAYTLTDNSYIDENIKINISEINKYDTAIYIASIKLSNIQYLKTAFANNYYGKNIKEKTSTIAFDNNAILAINGDYYGFRNSGYVIRNGTLYRNIGTNIEDLVINEDGSFQIINENNISAESLLSNTALHVFSFGPALIINNEISVEKNQEINGKSMVSNPRTAICAIDNLNYLFVTSDGRTSASNGLSLYELASILKEYNCTIAYNLDGGGSTTMVFNNKVINKPTTTGRIEEREVSDIVYIGY